MSRGRGGGTALAWLPLALVTGFSTISAPVPAVGQTDAVLVQPPDSEPEPILLELQMGRLARQTVQAYRVRTEALVPLTQFLQLAEIRYRLSPEGQLEASVDPGNRRLVVDALRDTMSYGSHRVRIEPEFKLFRDAELYVGAERLSDLLGLRIEVNWSDLRVTLVDPGELPIGRRVRREATRQSFLRRGNGPRPDLSLGPERPYWDGLVFDYSFLAPSTDPVAGGAYTAALGADALGGSLELATASEGPLEAGVTRVDASWTGVWRDSRRVKQLRLGDGVTTGPRLRTLRGVAVTNAPFLRPSRVGDAHYAGRLGPGWSVEAYRGGDLIAYDSADADGRFVVELPVRYGENPVDFIAYGPFGEIQEFNRTYRVLSELLPDRQFEYGASVGSCRSARCRATANLDLRYGATARWTVQAGFEHFWRDTLPDRFHPYAAVTGNPTNAWAVTAEAVARAFARGGLRYEPSLHLRLAAEYTRFADDTAAPLLITGTQRSQWGLFGFWRPVPRSGFFFLEASVDRTRTGTGALTRARLGASLQAAEARLLPFVRLNKSEPSPAGASARTIVGVNAFVLPRPQLGPVLGRLWLRSSLEASDSGVTSASAFAARQFGTAFRLEAGVGWVRGSAGPTYTVVLTSNLPMLRSYTTVTAPADAPASATQYVQGSVLWDRATRGVTAAPGPSLERAGLAGRVFLDENGNGLLDPGEPGVPRVRVLVGSGSARSDSTGLFRIWDVVPFEPILVTLDSLSLESPLLVPAFATVSVVPGPNRFRILDIPIARAGVIEGRVVLAPPPPAERRGIGGVTLFLTDRRTGARRAITTFTDGDFYALGIKPGDYELTVEERVLEVLGVVAEPVRFTLAPTPDGGGRSGIEVVLTPRR